MINKCELEEWNYQMLMLVQALIGSISPNFRMVALLRDSNEWVLKFYLERSVEEDIEEIEDAVCQYTAYQNSSLKCRAELTVGQDTLPAFCGDFRIVYRRKELAS